MGLATPGLWPQNWVLSTSAIPITSPIPTATKLLPSLSVTAHRPVKASNSSPGLEDNTPPTSAEARDVTAAPPRYLSDFSTSVRPTLTGFLVAPQTHRARSPRLTFAQAVPFSGMLFP
ncbi:hypothetical protein J1605_005941 [Eschrichtius robustus]|uniref:Uncharacterized protein n=1 Tax=Eschrichtius robustus TaxID=9764 RepID=A0AB34H832_ESCRO|nr:hypothetical protein J1605_005941 [Eschrichtius robustus]